MRPSDDIFQLVKSLTKSEKRYFKRYCKLFSAERNNNYLKLFKAIDQLSIYDEKKIKEKFKNEKFSKQLSVLKDYLKSLILKSLVMFNSSNSSVITLKFLVIEIDLLAHKRLFKQSYKLLKNTLQIAHDHEEFLILLDLYKIEKNLAIALENKDQAEKLEDIFKNEQFVIEQIKEYNNYLFIESKFQEIINIWGIADDNSFLVQYSEQLEGIFRSDLMKRSKKQLSLKSSFVFLRIFESYFLMNKDYRSAMQYSLKIIALFIPGTHFYESNIINYCGVLYGHVWNCIRNNKLNETPPFLKNLNNFLDHKQIKSSKSFHTKLYIGYVELGLLINNIKGKITDNKEIISGFENYIKNIKNNPDMNKLNSIYVYISINYLLCSEYNEALKWVNKVVNNINDKNFNYHVKMFALLVACVIHYELENYIYLEKFVKICEKHIKKINLKDHYILVFIKELLKICDCNSLEDKIFKFEYLRKYISEFLKKEGLEDYIFEFDLIIWLESKLKNKPMLEIVREKANKAYSNN